MANSRLWKNWTSLRLLYAVSILGFYAEPALADVFISDCQNKEASFELLYNTGNDRVALIGAKGLEFILVKDGSYIGDFPYGEEQVFRVDLSEGLVREGKLNPKGSYMIFDFSPNTFLIKVVGWHFDIRISGKDGYGNFLKGELFHCRSKKYLPEAD